MWQPGKFFITCSVEWGGLMLNRVHHSVSNKHGFMLKCFKGIIMDYIVLNYIPKDIVVRLAAHLIKIFIAIVIYYIPIKIWKEKKHPLPYIKFIYFIHLHIHQFINKKLNNSFITFLRIHLMKFVITKEEKFWNS